MQVFHINIILKKYQNKKNKNYKTNKRINDRLKNIDMGEIATIITYKLKGYKEEIVTKQNNIIATIKKEIPSKDLIQYSNSLVENFNIKDIVIDAIENVVKKPYIKINYSDEISSEDSYETPIEKMKEPTLEVKNFLANLFGKK